MKRLPPAALLPALLLLGACTLARPPRGSGDRAAGQLITAEMIRESGLSNGWEVLRRYASNLSFAESGRTPIRASQRGRQSVLLSEDPLLVVDGVVNESFRALAGIPARDIESIRILSALQASTRFGTRGGNGAILVTTVSQPQ